ncbi:MAG: 7TM diverse intracellular signaling domain-containing protein [Cyclobacteriaceae bacterium]|nr:7TM diverse intracellular signaling domain-containing protein [Cyclobacteriaceae bacterium]
MKRKIWLMIVCFTLWAHSVNADDAPLILNDGSKVYNPAQRAFFFADDHNTISIDDILQNRLEEKFIPITNKVPTFGLNNTPVWIRFDIASQLPEDFFLLIENPSLSSVDFFLVDASGIMINHVSTGSYQPIDVRAVKTANFYFDLQLKDSQVYTCYLKVRTSVSSMQIPMQIATMKHFYEQKHRVTLWQGLYFGLFVFMFIYNAFLFYSLRDTSYLYFASFIFFMGLMFAAVRGFGLEYLWSSNPFLNELVPVYGSLAGISVILFTARFLHSEMNTPKLHLWLIAIISLFVLNIIVFLTGWRFLAYQIILYNAAVTLFFIMFVALKVWLNGYEPAKYYLFAWSFFVAGIIAFFLRELGFLPINAILGNVLQIASTVSILFMSFALSRKINIYIESRNQAKELALQAALENERLISNQNQLLEARVTQRTIDL